MSKPDTSRLQEAIETAKLAVANATAEWNRTRERLTTLQDALAMVEGTAPSAPAPKTRRKRRTRQEIAAALSSRGFAAVKQEVWPPHHFEGSPTFKAASATA